MKILIVAATDFELEKDKFSAHEILITGVGILETSLELTKKLVLNRYDLVINAGIAGSFDNKIKIGDVVDGYALVAQISTCNTFKLHNPISKRIYNPRPLNRRSASARR